jgi:hypothetical protein
MEGVQLDRDEAIQRGLAHLMTCLQQTGVGVVKIDDGHVYAFTTEKLRELFEQSERSPSGYIIVFVRSGPNVESMTVESN